MSYARKCCMQVFRWSRYSRWHTGGRHTGGRLAGGPVAMLAVLLLSCVHTPTTAVAQPGTAENHNSLTVSASSSGVTSSSETGSGATARSVDSYVVGPEDVLEISVWKNPELTQAEAVRPDGRIALKLVGEVPVAGMTMSSLRKLLTEKYHDYVPTAEVSVTLKEMNSFKVYVLGRVLKPGEFKVKSSLTVLQALALSGGFTPYADERKIKVFRNSGGKEQILDFNYRKVVEGKAGDLELMPGDRLLIP